MTFLQGPSRAISIRSLPGAIVLAGSHGSSVYLAGPSGELWVVDLMQPDQPKLALSLNTYCSPKALTLSPAGDELRLVTTPAGRRPAWLFRGLDHLEADGVPWTLPAWQAGHKAGFLARCAGWMDDFVEPPA